MLFFMGGILSAYFKEFWETQNSDMKCIVIYSVLFILLCVCKWIDIPYISTLYVIAAPILFWKMCDVFVIFHLLDHEPVWFMKQSFFITVLMYSLWKAVVVYVPKSISPCYGFV